MTEVGYFTQEYVSETLLQHMLRTGNSYPLPTVTEYRKPLMQLWIARLRMGTAFGEYAESDISDFEILRRILPSRGELSLIHDFADEEQNLFMFDSFKGLKILREDEDRLAQGPAFIDDIFYQYEVARPGSLQQVRSTNG